MGVDQSYIEDPYDYFNIKCIKSQICSLKNTGKAGEEQKSY